MNNKMNMKRIVTIIAAITMLVAGMTAQTRALATLSHEEQLTFFYKASALEDAIEAAVDGDIIYLSDGKFGASQQSITIQNKKISIVGNGYNSHIVPNVKFNFALEESLLTLTAPLLDGVRLEKLEFANTQNSKPIQNVEIKKCFINDIKTSYADNILIDRCKISNYECTTYTNVSIYNSKIDTFRGYRCEIVENCNIKTVRTYSPSYITNSLIENFTSNPNGGVYENCIIVNSTEYITNNNELRNCYDLSSELESILDDNLECTISDMSPYVGIDGTVVGIYGGEWFPYSETPSVPTVDSAKSSVEFDKDNNQLKVTITVAPN